MAFTISFPLSFSFHFFWLVFVAQRLGNGFQNPASVSSTFLPTPSSLVLARVVPIPLAPILPSMSIPVAFLALNLPKLPHSLTHSLFLFFSLLKKERKSSLESSFFFSLLLSSFLFPAWLEKL
ncbi:hypothetical protein IE53DRAFT_262611 [Violaceomyces palustris]|uniref:Uncharacterized protein n=1 Tax=Violaceomyces palustris TaxID=1673888 RepID=A0ACD0NMZ5_9BASI|nr:hypothetical protein IE53DRAFT_262611 [Violaceomyces palustris]